MKTEELIKFRNLLQSHAGLYNVDARISEVCRLLQTTVDSTESTLLEQDAIYNFQDRYRSFLPKIDAIIADIGAYTANIDTIIDEQGKTEELDTSTQFKYGTPSLIFTSWRKTGLYIPSAGRLKTVWSNEGMLILISFWTMVSHSLAGPKYEGTNSFHPKTGV